MKQHFSGGFYTLYELISIIRNEDLNKDQISLVGDICLLIMMPMIKLNYQPKHLMMKNLYLSLVLLCFIGMSPLLAQNWETLNSGTGYILFDLSIPPGQSEVIYAAGMQYTYDAEGIIIKSTDGGDSWTQIVGGPNTIGFEAICFTSVDTGYVAGWDGYIAKTTDGGNTWFEMNTGGDNWYFSDLEFWDADHGIAMANLNSGGAGVYVTENGGDSWSTGVGLNQNVQDIAYADANTLYAVGGDEKISKSTNGGASWSQIYTGVFQYFFIGVDFNGDFGVIGGEDGKIMHTNDGGETWGTYATGYHNFQGVHVFNADSAYIGGTNLDVYKTTNSGSSWEIEYNGIGDSHIYKIKFSDDNVGFLCGSQGTLKRKAAPMIPLVADFEADQTDVCDAEEVNFTDLSTGEIETWSWTFEGGYPSDSQEPNPTIYYADAGTYDVSLTVTDANGESTLVMEDYITVHNCTGLINESIQTISLSPNPAQGFIRLDGLNGEQAQIKLYDLAGKLILENNFVVDVIDVSEVIRGIYLMNIKVNGVESQQKVVIE